MSLFNSKLSSAPPMAAKTQQNTAEKARAGASSFGSPPQANVFTIESVKSSVPAHLRNNVSQDLVDNLNNIALDPIMAEDIRNNFVSYSSILKEGRFKLDEYLNAVAYVSYKIMNNTNEEAYAKTFPQRYAKLIANGTSKKDISSYVSAYNKGKLVNLILEATLVPSWVLNQDLHQKAINRLADLMQTATSEKVQVEAASSLLTHLGKPKEGNFQINIGETENAGMKEMRALLQEVAANQREAIQTGRMKTIDVAAQRLRHEDDE